MVRLGEGVGNGLPWVPVHGLCACIAARSSHMFSERRTTHTHTQIVKNNKDYFDQSLDEIKLLKFVNSRDPDDEFGIVRLYDYFYYVRSCLVVCVCRVIFYAFVPCKHCCVV